MKAAFVITLLLIAQFAAAATIHVPIDSPTIQAGIDLALEGDTVLVADGFFTGQGNRDIDFNGKLVVLISENGSESTIIDCGGSSCGFNFHNGEDSTATVEGFTIQNGHATYGGAFHCSGASPTLRNCYIRDNVSGFGGGAIFCEQSDLTIENCTFKNNTATSGPGGGILFNSWAGGIITNCLFVGNHSGILGGAVCVANRGTVVLVQCEFRDNSTATFGGGLSLGSSAAEAEVVQCIFAGNQAGMKGGAVALGMGSSGSFTSSTFNDNSASEAGGAFSLVNVSSFLLEDCIIAFSSTGCAVFGTYQPGALSVSCCDVYGNAGGDWVEALLGQEGANGNFSLDPLFCNRFNYDFRLNFDSPCLPENNDCGVLIGAASETCEVICGDADRNGIIEVSDLVYLMDYIFNSGPPPVPESVGDVDCTGIVEISDVVYLLDYIFQSGPEPCADC